MIYGERRRRLLITRQGIQRNHSAVRGGNVEIAQGAGAMPEFRSCFQHNVILVQRRIGGANLCLSECVVESLIDIFWSDAESGGSGAIVDDKLPEPVVHLVAV